MDAKIFYTYLWLREDGTPYYVGKGNDRRAYRRGCPPHDRILIQPHPSEQDAFAAEVFFISYYGRKDVGTGCLRNLTDGGEGNSGRLFSETHRIRLRQSKIGNRNSIGWTKGRPRGHQAGAGAKRGVPKSAEHRLKISQSLKGNQNAKRQHVT